MGLRFTRRVSLFPGLRLNASRSGLSLSIGHRGLGWFTIGPRGRRLTVDILPGSGIYYTEKLPPQPSPSPARNRAGRALVIILLVIAAAWLFHT
jgi:Protein of unknown function (DUF4236)